MTFLGSNLNKIKKYPGGFFDPHCIPQGDVKEVVVLY